MACVTHDTIGWPVTSMYCNNNCNNDNSDKNYNGNNNNIIELLIWCMDENITYICM